MATNTLSPGAEVYGSDNKKIGKIKHFLSGAPEPEPSGTSERAARDDFDPGQTSTQMSATTASDQAGSTNTAEGIPLVMDDEPRSAMGGAAGAPVGPGVQLGPSDTKYFEVHHGGLLGIGGESVYIPFSAVHVVEEDGSVVLRYTAEEVASQYSQKPQTLDGE